MIHLDRRFLKSKKSELLYKGTKSGFKFEPFILACKGIKGSLMLAKTSNNRVFGAYTDIPWGYSNKKV